jgi:hypothetical protein
MRNATSVTNALSLRRVYHQPWPGSLGWRVGRRFVSRIRLPGERPRDVKPPRRDTRALSPAGMFGGKAPLSLAAQKKEQTARAIRAHAQCACLLSLQMGSIN